MDELQQAWNGKFGPGVKPPEWVFNFSAQDVCEQDVERKISESEARVGELKEEIEQELFLLAWLRRVRENGSVAAQSVGLVHISQSYKENHVFGETDLVFEEEEALNSPPVVSRESGIPDKSPVGTPDKASGKGSRLHTHTANCEDSPSSSEYHTAGQNSSAEEVSLTNLAEEVPCPSSPQHARQRLVRKVCSKDTLVAKEVLLRVDSKRVHRSCEVLSEANRGDCSLSLVRRHRRNSSAPVFLLQVPPQGNKKSEESPHISTLTPNLHSDTGASVESGHTEQSPFTNADTTVEVVLRDKIVRRPSLPISCEESMNQWKGTGGASSERANRSSNGVLDSGYNFMVNDEDSDPALINIIASRIRGGRISRTSVSTDDSPTDKQATGWGRTADIVSPIEDPCHTPIPGVEAAGASAKYTAPLRKRSSTHDSSPIKRERFSYHYSDDECLTPKLDSGDHIFSNSPNSSNRCSHRNSRSSNGIIDEEAAYDLTLRKEKSDLPRDSKLERKKTITPENPAKSHALALAGDGMDERHLTSTLTPHIGYSGARDMFDDRSDSFSELDGLKLGDLDLDVDLTLSKLRNKPDMSMATLLDMNENSRMNSRLSPQDPSMSEDLEYGESIEIDEATISAFTLSNDMYGSRSNSANSIPGLFSTESGISPPEQDSPTHSAHTGVNLRQSGGAKRSNRNRKGLDLELMTGGLGSDNDDMSRSSTSLTSEEESTSPIVDDNLVSVCRISPCIGVMVCLCL